MMIEEAKLIIKDIKPGLEKYLAIMNSIHYTDVSSDPEFQKRYNGFYRMRQRNQEFYKQYYVLLEELKSKDVTFEEIITKLFNLTARIEASFSSKMVATINPNMPVWDKYVLKNLGLQKPYHYEKNRLQKMVDLYDEIVKWYDQMIDSSSGKQLINLFDTEYPDTGLTRVKKVDLILWRIRG